MANKHSIVKKRLMTFNWRARKALGRSDESRQDGPIFKWRAASAMVLSWLASKPAI